MQSGASDDFLGHPKGLYVCFFTEMWERFSFYGMKALLLLYLIDYHLFGDHAGYDVIGAYGGLVYAIPVIGGLLADRYLGMRKAVVFGGILLCLGHLGMAFEGAQATKVGEVVTRDESALLVFYTSLALIIVGVGFLKPNISTIVGKLYSQDDPRRDSGFSLFYAGINLGALFASLVCGYLGQTFGWKYGFGVAGIGMVLGLGMFLWGQRYLHGLAEPADPQALQQRTALGISREWTIYLGSVLGLLPLAWLMWASANGAFTLGEHVSLALLLMMVMLGAVLLWFMVFILRQCTPVERDRMLALMALIFWALVFFTLYEQTYGSWVTFTDRLLTKDLFPSMVITDYTPLPWSIYSLILAPASFFVAARLSDRTPGSAAPKWIFGTVFAAVGVFLLRDLLVLPQTAGSLTFLGAMFIVLLAPIFTGLWGWLDRFGANPSKPIKSAIGLVFAGLAFVPLALAAEEVGATGAMASVWWLVLAYFVLEIGEMCLSPVGLSAVTQLSVARVTSLMMGTWFLATAFSETLAALFGKMAAIEEVGESLDLVAASAKYADLFWLMTWIGLGCAVLAFAVAPLLKRWMHGVR
ncbi:MAG: oligopeptide:H+ symporter [Xanthomonadales bacterium]|nr:oligopeptide:H+ symporter [Xanthomonadales bacterium]MCB1635393.1 oligopeptide:H+ symporter [Xanthomonadales bacterium]MCB1641614.1 oligopeptide:H+ symporter [Xanthomonadales bacterium]